MTLQQPVGSKMWHWKQRGCGVSEESLAKPGEEPIGEGVLPAPARCMLQRREWEGWRNQKGEHVPHPGLGQRAGGEAWALESSSPG